MTLRTPAEWRTHWTIAPGVTYLNHGSFGPSPREVQQARQRWTDELEAEPMDFFCRRLDGYIAEARATLASFLHCDPAGLVYVDNATAGMNVVANSFHLAPGDEVLLTDHEYGAVMRIWQQACDRAGARMVVAPLPTPLVDVQGVIDALAAHITPRTRLLVASHVTSATAVVLPIEAICQAARERGIATCVDGPHALVQVPVDLAALDCDYYTASCHKWLCAPFGSGFLYVHPRRRAEIRPTCLSWGHTPAGPPGTLAGEFDWPGTRDPAPWLAISAAIEFFDRAGVAQFRDTSHRLARFAREQIVRVTGLEPLLPDEAAWYGSMIALPMPECEALALQMALWNEERIETPVNRWQGHTLLRVSCHLYNEESEIERLAAALARLLG